MSGAAPAVRVFMSYSRKDASFVARLAESLQSKGYDVFVDTEDISGGEEWQKRLDQLILNTDAVAFVISPDSVASKICDWEIQRTLELGKRIIPVLWRPLDQQSAPAQLAERNYIFFDDPERFEPSLTQLCNACDVDIAWVREHTRLIALATRWQAESRGRDGLLRGAALEAARAWAAARAPRAPEIPRPLKPSSPLPNAKSIARAAIGAARLQLLACSLFCLSVRRGVRHSEQVAILRRRRDGALFLLRYRAAADRR